MGLTDLLILFTVAGVVVYVFQRVRLPSIVGLLTAGVLVGPHQLGWVSEPETVHLLAEVGVVVLLFAVGLEFSLSRLASMAKLMFTIGAPQVLACVGAGVVLTWGYLGSLNQAIFAGMLVAMSSTAVVIKLLADRSELDSSHGRIAVAVLLFQDLLVVAAVLAVPLLATRDEDGPSPLRTLFIGVLVVGAILAVGVFVLPNILYAIVRTRNRELFLIAIVLVCLGTATLTGAVGLSPALGAFLAGLTLSESEYGHQMLTEVLPFRDTLSSLFFVSIGMLLDVAVLLESLDTVLVLVGAILVVKFLAATLPALLTGHSLRTSMSAGLSLAQIGEFSFVLALSGRQYQLLNDSQYQKFLAASVLTMVATPFLIALAPRLANGLAGWKRLSHFVKIDTSPESPTHTLRDHVIIAGYGFNGKNLATALRNLGIAYVVLEMNPETVRKQRRAGESILFGDCTRPAVLEHAGLKDARVFVVAISDPTSTRRAVQLARRLNSEVRIVVRTRYQSEMTDLYKLGADQVVPEEFETSIEVLARVLREFGIPSHVIRRITESIRADQYESFLVPGLMRAAPFSAGDVRLLTETDSYTLPSHSPSVGKTIGELRLRSRTGASIIAIRRGMQLLTNPGAEVVLEPDDVIVMLGNPDQIESAIELITPSTEPEPSERAD
jgi:CPA2 family monovalent cation:H+ antiporter-2